MLQRLPFVIAVALTAVLVACGDPSPSSTDRDSGPNAAADIGPYSAARSADSRAHVHACISASLLSDSESRNLRAPLRPAGLRPGRLGPLE